MPPGSSGITVPLAQVRKVRDPAKAILSAVTVRKLGVAELDTVFLAAGRIANHAVVLNNTMVSLVEGLKESVATCMGAFQLKPLLTQAGPAFAVTTLSDSSSTAMLVAQCTPARGLVVCDQALYDDATKVNDEVKASLKTASEALVALTTAVTEANEAGCGISYEVAQGSLGLKLPPVIEEAPKEEAPKKEPMIQKGLVSKSVSKSLSAVSKGAALAVSKAKKIAAKSGEEDESGDGGAGAGEGIEETGEGNRAGCAEAEAAETIEGDEETAEGAEGAAETTEPKKKEGRVVKSVSVGLGAVSKGATLAVSKAKKLAAKLGEGEGAGGADAGESIDETGEDEIVEGAKKVSFGDLLGEGVAEVPEDEGDDDVLDGFEPDEPADGAVAAADEAALTAAAATVAVLSKRQQFEKAKEESALQKVAFRACTTYCQALFRLRLALVSARFEGVLQGGLRAAVDEIRARVSEAFSAAGRPIDWLKVISLDLLKLLEGKLVFKLKLSFDHLQMDAALKKCLHFLTRKMVRMVETIAVKCYCLLKESITMIKQLTDLVVPP